MISSQIRNSAETFCQLNMSNTYYLINIRVPAWGTEDTSAMTDTATTEGAELLRAELL